MLRAVAGLLIPALAAFAARRAAGRGYHAIARAAPPRNPADPGVAWKDALLWTVGSAMVAGVARLGVRRWLAGTRWESRTIH